MLLSGLISLGKLFIYARYFVARLFVAEGFDRIKFGSLHGGEPAADHADDNKNDRGQHHGDKRESEVDVHFAGVVFIGGAEEGQRANRGSNGRRKQHANYAGGERHDQRFQQELPANVRFLRTERAAQTDLANAFFDGDEHDIHHAHTADPERECAHKKEQRFDAQSDSFVDGLELFAAKHGNGALVVRREVLAVGDGRAELLHGVRFKIWRYGFEQHDAGVARIPQVACRGVGNKHRLIVAREIIAIREFRVHGADNGEFDAVNAHRFADGGRSAEKFPAQDGAEESHAAALGNIFGRDPAAFHGDFIAHFAVFGINAADGGVREPFIVRNSLPAHRLSRHALDQRGLRFHPIRVFLFESHRLARALSARLFTGRSRPANDSALAKDFERVHQHATKT